MFRRHVHLPLVAWACSVIAGLGQTPLPNLREDGTLSEADFHRLADSPRVEDRIKAADYIGLDFHYPAYMPTLWKLLKDDDKQVQGEAAYSITSIAGGSSCTTPPPHLSKSDVAKLASFLRKRIDKVRPTILEHYGGKERDIWLLSCRVRALNSLRYWYPLASKWENERWQENTMFPLLLALLRDREKQSDQLEHHVLGLLGEFDDADTAKRALDAVFEQMDTTPPKRVEDTFLVLWRHRLFGPDRPLHDYAVKLVLPHLPDFRTRVLGALTGKYDPQNFEFYLREFGATNPQQEPKLEPKKQ